MKDLTCFKEGKGFSVFMVFAFLTSLLINPTYAGTQLKSKPKIAKLNIPFIVNQGQTDDDVRFYANTFGGTVFVTRDGSVVYSIPKNEARSNGHEAIIDTKIEGIALKEEFLNSNIKEVNGEEKAVSKVNYIKGEKSDWKTNIPTYGTVNLGEIYKGIELKLKAYGNNVEKLFYVKPNTNPEKIKVKLSGADNLKINENGELEVNTALGVIKFTKPVAYQAKNIPSPLVGEGQGEGDRKYIDVTYVADGNEYGFKLGDYDKSKELVIDPLLASTFLGGSGEDYISSIAIDQAGNAFVVGTTYSPDFPTTPGAYDVTYNNWGDVFVSKLSSDLTQLLSSTFIGGSNDEGSSSLVIDNSGNVYIAGGTSSSDFPTTLNAYNTSFNGNGDVFVAKLSGDLSQLLVSTFVGGSGSVGSSSLAIDKSGNVYIAGSTSSPDFPTTAGAYDTSFKEGQSNWFISKLDSNLSGGNALILVITKSGTGNGTVSSSPAGITCGTDCSEAYIVGTAVTLTATPDIGSIFTGWGGACTGTGICTISMDANKSVVAIFDLQTLPSTPSQSQGQGSGTNNQGTSNALGLQNAPGIQNAPGLQKK